MGTPTDTTDNVQVQNQAENRMETSTDPTDDVQVQNQAENHMETPTDPTDDVQAQNQAAICIEVPQGIRDIRRAANRSRNCLQDGTDVRNLREVNRPGRPARRTNTERQPQQRQGWHWNRIYPRGDHSKSDTQGKRKYSNSYQEILLLKTSLNSTLLKKLLMFLLPKQIYMRGSILKGKGIP